MSEQSLADKIAAAKAQQKDQQKPEEIKDENKDLQGNPDELETLVASFGTLQTHPQAPIIMDEISEEEKAQALAAAQSNVAKPEGLYAYSAGSIFGKRGLVKLTVTPFGNFQSEEDMEATGTRASWEHLIKIGQAYVVE